MNFLLVGDRVLIRTGSGTKLEAALRNAVVAFEVDDIDAFSHAGWSVTLTGKAEEVTDPDELRRIARLPLAHWATNSNRVIAVSLDLISGRRISECCRAGVGHHEEG